MKLCIDCEHCSKNIDRFSHTEWKEMVCAHIDVNPVDGGVYDEFFPNCWIHRTSEGNNCGKDAKFFSPVKKDGE